MMKIRIVAFLMYAFMAAQIFMQAVSANTENTDSNLMQDGIVLVPSIADEISEENLLPHGDFDDPECLGYITTEYGLKNPRFNRFSDSNGGYICVFDIPMSHYGIRYTPQNTIGAGKYLFTGYFRTLRGGQLSELRIIIVQKDGTSKLIYAYPTNDWLEVNYYFETTDEIDYIKVCGGSSPEMVQEYCFDHFSLVPVTEIPADAATTFGTKVSSTEVAASMPASIYKTSVWDPEVESQYDVEGLIINHDFSGFLGYASVNGITEEEIAEFAKQYEGTHVTDYFISANDVCSMFPNGVVTSYLDKYYWTEENGQAVDYSKMWQAPGSVYLYETLGVDPIGILHESFREIGINPWISFRMNDAHDMISQTSIVFSEFYHKHPEIRRVQHHSFFTYHDRVMNYTYELVREYMLSFINEALNRYDTYGIELDFLRDIWLFNIGGEYKGLDIFNEFMRQVDDLVAIYEEKYGHKIKIATRVAYDFETNYNFGLDVITWIAEGSVDMVIPASRYSTVDMDIPTRMWDSITEPYGVELAVSMEQTQLSPSNLITPVSMDVETMSAFAANAFSQGAEKVYIFNYYKSSNDFFTDEEKISTNDPQKATMWTMLTTLGSYEKLMTMNRRNIVTWKDVKPSWLDTVKYFTQYTGHNKFITYHVPIGDIPEGAKVTLKISASETSAFTSLPTIYVNSALADYIGADLCDYNFTNNMLLCYDVPESLWGNDYLTVDIQSHNVNGFAINYVEVFIQAPDSELN